MVRVGEGIEGIPPCLFLPCLVVRVGEGIPPGLVVIGSPLSSSQGRRGDSSLSSGQGRRGDSSWSSGQSRREGFLLV